ncbi:MAG: hypothetical protein JWN32_2237 [Solirubrobacterales bacterium]|nr:hypothetical protein [Solirubrobacterales bacterium]
MRRHAPPTPEELGDQVAFLALDEGTPVYERDGDRIGVVEHVMVAEGIFEGIVIHTHPLPGRHLYAAPDQIAEIRERGVVLAVERSDLHDPSDRAGRRQGGPGSSLEAALRRAWDWLTEQRP